MNGHSSPERMNERQRNTIRTCARVRARHPHCPLPIIQPWTEQSIRPSPSQPTHTHTHTQRAGSLSSSRRGRGLETRKEGAPRVTRAGQQPTARGGGGSDYSIGRRSAVKEVSRGLSTTADTRRRTRIPSNFPRLPAPIHASATCARGAVHARMHSSTRLSRSSSSSRLGGARRAAVQRDFCFVVLIWLPHSGEKNRRRARRPRKEDD